eukprot:2075681-Amphidinium_carterae.3
MMFGKSPVNHLGRFTCSHRVWTFSPPGVLAPLAQGRQQRGCEARPHSKSTWGAKACLGEMSLNLI